MKSQAKKVVGSIILLTIVILGFQNCGVEGVSDNKASSSSTGAIVDDEGGVYIPGPSATPGPGGATPTPTPSATPVAAGMYPVSSTINVSAKVGDPFEVRIPFAKSNAVATTFVRNTSTGPLTVNLVRLSIAGTGALFFGFTGSVNVVPAGTHTEIVTFNAPTAEGAVVHKLVYTVGGVTREITLNVSAAP